MRPTRSPTPNQSARITAYSTATTASLPVSAHRICPTSRSLRCSAPCGSAAMRRMATLAASTKVTPMIPSCTSGQRLSVQLSTSAPASAAPSAATCTAGPCPHRPPPPPRSLRLVAELVGDDDAEPCDLRHGEVDEDNAAAQDLHAERYMRRCDEQARQQRGQDDAEPCAHFKSARSRARLSS